MKEFRPLVAALVLQLTCLPLYAQGVDPETGLIVDAGYETVKANCTACHSPKLIIQNRASRDGWLDTIRWMQAEQNLKSFDPATEKTILDYLARNYAPGKQGRRAPLRVENWFMLGQEATEK